MAFADSVVITPNELVVGTPITWSVYDRSGTLLLNKGFVIASERQRESLLRRGVKRDTKESVVSIASDKSINFGHRKRYTVFENLEFIIERLDVAYRQLKSTDKAFFHISLSHIALDVQLMCSDNPDALLGALQIDRESPYGLIHPLHAGVLCELVAKRLKMPAMQRLTLICAAISHDIGITELQETLHKQTDPLTDEQWKNIRQHPQNGYDLLKAAGVNDELWLKTILQHHERTDGSGYPLGLKDDKLLTTSKLLAVADIYTAMVRPKRYKEAAMAQDALRDIFAERGQGIDDKLAQLFIKEVGIFPPGAFVRLRNREIAIIRDRGDGQAPTAIAIIGSSGNALKINVERDTARAEFAVLEMVPQDKYRAVQVNLNKLWPPMRPINCRWH